MADINSIIKNECLKAETTDAVKLLISIMKNDALAMHGPFHHILDGSVLLTVMHNAGVEFDLSSALDEMAERGGAMPGATCGKWGVCGASCSVGAAISIINKTGPLSNTVHYKNAMKLTSRILSKISDIGGPRCCKRNAFISLTTAVDFVNEAYSLSLPKTLPVCEFSAKNMQCIGSKCPFCKDK